MRRQRVRGAAVVRTQLYGGGGDGGFTLERLRKRLPVERLAGGRPNATQRRSEGILRPSLPRVDVAPSGERGATRRRLARQPAAMAGEKFTFNNNTPGPGVLERFAGVLYVRRRVLRDTIQDTSRSSSSSTSPPPRVPPATVFKETRNALPWRSTPRRRILSIYRTPYTFLSQFSVWYRSPPSTPRPFRPLTRGRTFANRMYRVLKYSFYPRHQTTPNKLHITSWRTRVPYGSGR